MFHVMLDNAQSADKKVAQILGECAMVCATKTCDPEIFLSLPAQIIYILLFTYSAFSSFSVIHKCGLHLLGVYSIQ